MKVAIISCKMEPTRFLRQAELLKILKHRNIVQLHGVCKEPLYIWLLNYQKIYVTISVEMDKERGSDDLSPCVLK